MSITANNQCIEWVRGTKHYAARLSDDMVLKIRADARTQYAIAAEYGISQQSVSDIKRRKKWAWL